MSTPCPRDALAQYQEGRLSETALLRALMIHPEWTAPAALTDTGPAIRCQGEGQCLLFSDDQAVSAYLAKEGIERIAEESIRTVGYAAFANLPEDAEEVVLDRHSPGETRYPKERLPELRRLARAVRVEEVLANLVEAEDPFGQLREYDGYTLVFGGDDEDPSLVLAPDSKGRRLAAVFTADDNLEAFIGRAGETLGIRPGVLPLSGDRLCELLRRMPLDGVVFNCMGPVPPRAFTLELLDHMLTG